MPIVHKVRDERARARLMTLFAHLGFRGHYHRDMQRRGWKSLEEFSQVFAHVLETDINYLTAKQLSAAAERAGLRISFAFTKDLFVAKALSYSGRRPYRYRDAGMLESLGFWMGKFLASVTVQFRRAD